MNREQNQVYLDIPLALAYGEILVSAELKQSVWELRLTGLRRLQSQMVLQVSSQTELDKVICPRAPHFDGNKLIPDKYSIPEEELICWCETSLRGPLNEYGQHRYMEVFRQVFPEYSKVIDMRESL